MSWNQSVCFLKNKLAWSGCGLVWQVGCGRICSVWVCIVLVGLVWVWQVRCVGVRCVVLRLVPFRCGRFGGSEYVEVRHVAVWQVWSGRFGFVRFWWVRLGHDLAGQVRCGKASYAEVR